MSTSEIENFIELTNNQITDYESELAAHQGRLNSEQENTNTPTPDEEI